MVPSEQVKTGIIFTKMNSNSDFKEAKVMGFVAVFRGDLRGL